ncbi:MAG: GNAT family N-acetyltransferase [Nocardioides sp.]
MRRVLRGEKGPSGGPALTDLLGICTAWGDGSCVVQPESGAAVTIALGDIVSGKPVPQRPSPRHRVTPEAAQRRAGALFADLETEPLGAWVLRRSATAAARRANSVLAFRPSGVADAVDRVVDHYGAMGQRPIAAVLPDSAEEELFRRRGWVLESRDPDTVFLLASVAAARRAMPGVVSRLASLAPQPPLVELVEATGLATARIGQVASGVAAYADDWVGLRGLEVDPEHRRQGLGLIVVDALLEWGAENGATTAYLQVLADNAPALALYERLGFRTHHAYRYLAPV